MIANYAENQNMIDDKTTVYLCENFSCKSPITNSDKLKKELRKKD